MRIGFDVTALCTPVTGVGAYTLNLWRHLERLSLDEVWPLSHRLWTVDGAGWRDDSMRAGVLSRASSFNKTVWMQTVLPWQLKRLGADLCHFTNTVASLWTPCPSILTIHDMTVWLFPELHYPRRQLAMRPFVPLAARRAAAIIAVSQATKDDAVRILGVEASRVHVVYEAAAPHFKLVEDTTELERVRASYGLPQRIILHVGTIEPRKNLVRLLEAYAHLRKRQGLSHGLIFAGGMGWKHEGVFAAVERLGLEGAVLFLGYVPTLDLVTLYNLADVVVLPSLYEGFGLPLLEAMVSGTPVVTSSEGSLREVAGSAAEFVDSHSVKSIAAGLWRVLDDSARREELRARGLKRAARFGWDTAARQTRKIYAQVQGGEVS